MNRLVSPVLVLLVAVPAPALGLGLRSTVIGNGATPSAGITGTGRVLRGTAGQAAVGVSGGAHWTLCHGFWCTEGAQVVWVDPGPSGGGLPRVLELGPAVPNPSPGALRFVLALPAVANVKLALFDVQGRMVGSAADGRLDPGVHSLRWGGATAPGVYFARLTVDGRAVARRRVVIVR